MNRVKSADIELKDKLVAVNRVTKLPKVVEHLVFQLSL